MRTLLGVIGNPILHSKSPLLHRSALEAAGIESGSIRLSAIDVKEAFQIAREMGLHGLNVTAPFKENAFRQSDEPDEAARQLGAANTVLFGETIRCWNTDVYGVAETFRSNGVKLSGETAVILGAGAAARAAAFALKSAGAEVSIANRTFEKAAALAEEFGCTAVALSDPSLAALISKSKILLSCLSTSEPVLPAGVLRSDHIILDAVYGKETALVREAVRVGARCISGLEWLLHQGAKSLENLCGITPSLPAMRRGLAGEGKPAARSIALIGMPASGKTKVAGALAAASGMTAVDLDHEIVAESGKSIADIFNESGEETFRDMESNALARYASAKDIVLSTGGGIVLREENRRLLKENFLTIWLWVSTGTLAERVTGDTKRPLLAGGNVKARLEQLLLDRRGLYADSADLVLSAGRYTPEDRAKRIMYEMRAAGIR